MQERRKLTGTEPLGTTEGVKQGSIGSGGGSGPGAEQHEQDVGRDAGEGKNDGNGCQQGSGGDAGEGKGDGNGCQQGGVLRAAGSGSDHSPGGHDPSPGCASEEGQAPEAGPLGPEPSPVLDSQLDGLRDALQACLAGPEGCARLQRVRHLTAYVQGRRRRATPARVQHKVSAWKVVRGARGGCVAPVHECRTAADVQLQMAGQQRVPIIAADVRHQMLGHSRERAVRKPQQGALCVRL